MTDCQKCPDNHPSSVCFIHSRSCFLIFCGLSWYDSHTLCPHYGGHPAIVNDSTTVQAITKQFKSRIIKCKRYWIGLSSFSWTYNDTFNKGECLGVGIRQYVCVCFLHIPVYRLLPLQYMITIFDNDVISSPLFLFPSVFQRFLSLFLTLLFFGQCILFSIFGLIDCLVFC